MTVKLYPPNQLGQALREHHLLRMLASAYGRGYVQHTGHPGLSPVPPAMLPNDFFVGRACHRPCLVTQDSICNFGQVMTVRAPHVWGCMHLMCGDACMHGGSAPCPSPPSLLRTPGYRTSNPALAFHPGDPPPLLPVIHPRYCL